MPDLDQLFDALVADVTTGSRPPGAPKAIGQARRRRTRAAVMAVGVVALIAVGGGVVAGTRGSDRVSPIDQPEQSSSEPPTVKPTSDPAKSDDPFATELRRIVAQAPTWTLTDTASMSSDSSFAVCAGDWGAGGFGGGTMNVGTSAEPATAVGMTYGVRGVPSEAMTRLVHNLASCTAYSWRIQPVPDSGAVLAYSADGVVWVHRRGTQISTLEVGTAEGPPPPAVQIEVAHLMWSEMGKTR
jgi:hypothetical protein